MTTRGREWDDPYFRNLHAQYHPHAARRCDCPLVRPIPGARLRRACRVPGTPEATRVRRLGSQLYRARVVAVTVPPARPA